LSSGSPTHAGAPSPTTAPQWPASFDGLFEHHPWRVLIVRPAARDLAGLQVIDKEAALRSLATLATGVWSGHDVKHLSGQSIPSELSLYESKFGKGARIIWTVGIDFVPMVGLYQQTIRVWAVDRSHDDAQRSIQRVCAIHRRGLTSVLHRRLKTRVQRVKGTDVVLPKSYQVAPEGSVSLETLETTLERSFQRSGLEGAAAAAASVVSSVEGGVESADVAANAEEHTVRYPPAVEQEDAYNLVKFYTLERSLVWSILAATFTEKLEFPFLPDEAEHLIISLAEHRSILLIGRSGTGKTTIVVQRMWLQFRTRMEALRSLHLEAGALSTTRWLGTALPLDGEMGTPMPRDAPPELVDGAEAVVDETTEDGTRGDALSAAGASSGAQYGGARTLHQLFVTANPILRTAVARSFKSLQSGFVESLNAELDVAGIVEEGDGAQDGARTVRAAVGARDDAATAAEADAELASLLHVRSCFLPLMATD